ncbi:Crp/Fnr family transcriptional regulator [Mycoplasmatota bacterium]|nr:Crp/Fnr family transcriptional regulator [Mycoplasmatota bacterium]
MNRIFKCKLFKSFTLQEINHFLRKYRTITRNYQKNDIVFFECEECDKIGIVISGSIEIQNVSGDGKMANFTTIESGNIFGEVLLYSEKKSYPATLIASDDTTVLYIEKEVLLKALGEHKKLLVNFLELLANRTLNLHNRVKVITKHTLKSKIASYILSNSNNENRVPIGMTKEKLAEYLSVQRPSLSRELIQLKDEGLIDYDRKYFYILDRNALESV